MEKLERYSVPAETIPDVLRAFGELAEMAQNAPYEPDNSVFVAINAMLCYIADDLEAQINEMTAQYLNLLRNNKGGKTA